MTELDSFLKDNLKKRVAKIEQAHEPSSLAIVYLLDDKETEKEAYYRRFPADSYMKRHVIYIDTVDARL